jgi:hypothetical protein
MITLIERLASSRYWYPVLAGIGAFLLFGFVLTVKSCGRVDHTAERQVEQTTKSGQAITAAASDAIQIIGDRIVNDKTVDNAINDATKEINNAKNIDDVRRAVIDGVCQQKAHRFDPACRVRSIDTGH